MLGNQSEVESTHFSLHYGSGKNNWLIIQQTTVLTDVRLENYTDTGEVFVEGKNVSVHRQVKDINGNFTKWFFKFENVGFHVLAIGLPETEVLQVISSLKSLD